MTQCPSHMATGGRCDLQAGHDGEHEKTYGLTAVTWTDESQADLIDKLGGTKGT